MNRRFYLVFYIIGLSLVVIGLIGSNKATNESMHYLTITGFIIIAGTAIVVKRKVKELEKK